MNFRLGISFILSILVSFATSAVAAPGAADRTSETIKGTVRDSLDQGNIHAIYSEGDFEGVIAKLDGFTSTHAVYTLSDSIFIAKHLAVIYSANPATREKGKNYMFRLLNLMPSAKIVDMFVSDEIDRIFEKVREEYTVRQRSLGRQTPSQLESTRYAANKLSFNTDSATISDLDRRPGGVRAVAKPKGSSRAYYWVAGGVALAAVAGTAYYFLAPRKPADKIYDLPD